MNATAWIVVALGLFVVVVIALVVHQLRGIERREPYRGYKDPLDGWGSGQPFKVPE